MNVRKAMIIMLSVTLIFTSTALYTNAEYNKNKLYVEKVAYDFLIKSPTFVYDGSIESIQIIETYSIETYPTKYIVIISFNTSHAGWGDREGTFTAQIITPHVIKLTIIEGMVLEAIIDDIWDEINQIQLPTQEFLIVEDARDITVSYLLDKYPEQELEIPAEWISITTSPSELVGTSTTKFTSGDWEITLNYQVIQNPDFDVYIEYVGENGFSWHGTVFNNGSVSEISMTQ